MLQKTYEKSKAIPIQTKVCSISSPCRMKITLISLYNDIICYGLRILSSYLKNNGVEVQIIFLPYKTGNKINELYSEDILNQLTHLCIGSKIIGISLMTNFFNRALQVTKMIKNELGITVVWGGVHPTVNPDECIQYADMVCIGESEEALLELCNRLRDNKPITDIKNLWIKEGNKVYKNIPRPLLRDIGSLPFQDFDLNNHYILHNEKILKMSKDLLKEHFTKHQDKNGELLINFNTMATRGCPHSCSYCYNSFLKKLYKTEFLLRKRPITNVIDEIVHFKNQLNFIGIVTLSDDTFFMLSNEEIKQFAEEYKKRVNLPLRCLTSPLTLNETKLKYLVDAWLIHLGMGIETACEKTKTLYNRKIPNHMIIKATGIINKYKNYLRPPKYDIIMENPYESLKDNLETLRFLTNIPKPFEILSFKLIFFPGTEIYEKAKKDGIIHNEKDEIYNRSFSEIPGNFINMLYFNVHIIPRPILKILLKENIAKFLNKEIFNGFWFALHVYLRMSMNDKTRLSKYIMRKILNKTKIILSLE